MSSKVCIVCESPFEAKHGSAKICSDACRKARAAAWYRAHYAAGRAHTRTCDMCGKGMRTETPQGDARCLECRRSEHGYRGYKRGCRCDECKAGVADRAREFNAAYKAVHGVTYSVHYRQKRAEAGPPITSRVRHWITHERRHAIYARDGWTCHLCGGETSRVFSPDDRKSPTLDHLVPVSLGGGNESSNLKTACWSCNSSRGSRELV